MIPDLISLAIAARERAYAPYSRYRVGAAVLTTEGASVAGVNVENASYGLTVCAERVAVFTAIAAGARRIREVAVVTGNGASPCGACRQVLREFGGDDLLIHVARPDGTTRTITLGSLLPESFGPSDLAALPATPG